MNTYRMSTRCSLPLWRAIRLRHLYFALTIVASPGSLSAQHGRQDGIADAVVGTWRLVSYEDTDSAGHHSYPFGTVPLGLLVYTADGHMSIQIAKTPLLPNLPASYDDSSTVASIDRADLVRMLDGYVAYFGTYSVDTTRRLIIHHVTADLSRLYPGTDQPRPFRLVRDTLILTDGHSWRRAFLRVTARKE